MSEPAEPDHATTPVAVQVPTGYRVGAWEVTGLIASGAWGTVYEGRRREAPTSAGDPPQGTAVALKFLSTATLSPQQRSVVADMVRAEVALAGRAPHPRLVRTYESIVLHDPKEPGLDGAVVLVMERARTNLRDWARSVSSDGPEGSASATRLLREVAEGLAHLHPAGIVHGDLKPANVLIADDGSARLADFGLARELDGTHAYTQPRLGSVDFVPPEHWTEPVSEHGVASRTTGDIWAFGVIAHVVLTGGQWPFPGATAQARSAAARTYAAGRAELRLSDRLPAGWRPVVADCLAPDHQRRQAVTASDLVARVAALEAGQTERTGRGARSRRGGQRRWPQVVAAAVVGAALVIFGVSALRPDGVQAPKLVTSDSMPCDRDQVTRLGRRVQYCPLFRPETPVFSSPDQGNAAATVGTLRSGGRQNWFVGQAQRSVFRLDGSENTWWAFTLSDDRTWGWVPEVYFAGGKDNEPDAGLAVCNTRGNACRE